MHRHARGGRGRLLLRTRPLPEGAVAPSEVAEGGEGDRSRLIRGEVIGVGGRGVRAAPPCFFSPTW